MTSLDQLARQFERFPGIGPRQARRFVHHLLTEAPDAVERLAVTIAEIQSKVTLCTRCFQHFAKNNGTTLCDICSDPNRDSSLLMVVERDADIVPIERSGTYDGYYFVLGGTVPLLDDSENEVKLRGGALKGIVEVRAAEGLQEVILAFSVNPDGENTARYVSKLLADLAAQHNLTITTLGRGLSTGSELEYADPETIKNALRNRA